MRQKKEPNVEELMKAMAIELEPAEKLKQPAEHPENFDLFMARAIQIKPKCKRKGTRNSLNFSFLPQKIQQLNLLQ